MKKIILLSIILHFALIATSCFSQGTWTKKADVGGPSRYRAVSFVIGTNISCDSGTINRKLIIIL